MPQNRILSSIVRITQEHFIGNDIKKSMESFLDELLSITDSEYGFIGTIEENSNDKFLRTLAITDIAWNEETRQFYNNNIESGIEFFNLDSLFGEVIKTQNVVISNTPADDIRGCGIPNGHPPLKSFLGIPFICGDRFVGMCGIANRPEGYDEELVDEVEAIIDCIASLIYNYKLQIEKKALSEDLHQKSILISKIFKNSADAIIAVSKEGIIKSASDSALKLFGYSNHEMIGQNIKIIVNDEHRDQHDRYLKDYLETGKTKIINTIRVIDAVKKDGSAVPIELSISAIEIGDVWFLGIIRDLSTHQKYLNSINEAKQAAERHNQAKSEFMAIMTHELKTPLAGIMGALQPLLDDGHIDSHIAQAYKESQKLLKSLNTILDYSRLKVGLYDIDEHSFDLKKLLDEINDLCLAKATSKNLDFEVVMKDPPGCNFISAPYRIKQVLINLLDNAMKFTSEGQVTVTVNVDYLDEESALCCFDIVDTGCGIPHEQIDKIFSDFSQPANKDKTHDGFGLGLSISLMIAEILDGQLAVDSEVGKGTTITLCLPLKIDPGKQSAELSETGKKVLIVEDNPVNQKVLMMMLSKFELEADIAENGCVALEMLKNKSYPLIFMDLMMPEMNGFECALNIRETDSKTPIITVSANNDAENVKKSRECGMNDFISKPISKEKLKNLAEKYGLI